MDGGDYNFHYSQEAEENRYDPLTSFLKIEGIKQRQNMISNNGDNNKTRDKFSGENKENFLRK